MFAREIHKDQGRKYTNNPYVEHLAEVAGIVATVSYSYVDIAVAWLHDCMEDQGITESQLIDRFGKTVAHGVGYLTDVETGNRKERKAASRLRLECASPWVQNVKVADLISNTGSIAQHDPKFAKVYLEEKELLLNVLKYANASLVRIARDQIVDARKTLKTK